MEINEVKKCNLRRGADILLELLESEGVEFIFGNPGTTELPLMDALIKCNNIKYIFALQEASVVAMADGYAQAAKKPGFINLHTAGGLGHGMGNLLNASVSQTPLVVTAGQQDSRHMITDPLLFGDLVSIAKPASKWSREVSHISQLPVLVRRAFHDADAAPKGPVFLSFPMDIMEGMSDINIGAKSTIEQKSIAGSLVELAIYLTAVKPGRLAIIAGDEIHYSNASSEVVKLAETLGAPVFGSSWPSRIPYPTAHHAWRGNLPTSAKDISEKLSEYDAIFALGGKSLITILYSDSSALPAGCDVFQLSLDVSDLGRTYPTKLSVVGDIKKSLEMLQNHIESIDLVYKNEYSHFSDQNKIFFDESRLRVLELSDQKYLQNSISPIVAAREALRAIGTTIPIVDEALVTSGFVRKLLCSDNPGQYSFLRGGGLGWGMPAAVGCSLGYDRSPVVCLVGDGAALYSPQALWTAAHEKLPITFVIMNNREYNILKNFMRSQKDYNAAKTGQFIAMDIINPTIDYQALAKSFGLPSIRIEKSCDIAEAINAGIKSGVANIVEIMIGSN
ncbi:thiamine pyrophosphate-binding protein [Klebsiella aerogenes]